LVYAFIRYFNQVYKKHIANINPSCLAILRDYNWPGNVRELKNVIQRAMLLCEDETIQTMHLPSRFKKVSRTTADKQLTFKIGTPLDEIEKETILHTLRITSNNRTEAARLLGISRRALYNRLKKHDIT
jgi:transcriptional regulator with PAS, ATPase and Fis domain